MATTPAPPATTWGNPTAPKRALLLHGLTSCSHAWVRVAEGLVENGGHPSIPQLKKGTDGCIDYYIVAPDLLGHGNARRPSPSTNGGEYTVVALAADLQPHIHPSECTPPISLIIGHSLGALIALELIPSLLPNPRPLRMILVDPPLEVHHSLLPGIRASCIAEIAHVPSIEAYGMKNPLWTRKDVVARVTGTMLCDPDAVSAIIEVRSSLCLVSLANSIHNSKTPPGLSPISFLLPRPLHST